MRERADAAAATAPVHLQPRWLLVVFVGGTFGGLCRFLLSHLGLRDQGSFPWATFGTNVAGAFALGLLLEVLVRRGADEGSRRTLRLGVGTGVLGAFTTYSALAGETVLLVREGAAAVAAAYAVLSATAGVLAAGGGIALVAALDRRRTRVRRSSA